MRNEAYFTVRRNDEGRVQRSRWVFFNSLLEQVAQLLLIKQFSFYILNENLGVSELRSWE